MFTWQTSLKQIERKDLFITVQLLYFPLGSIRVCQAWIGWDSDSEMTFDFIQYINIIYIYK